ncbi:MAG: serine/threonine-protein phosphatase [SAR324 cluster bacterium]|nr:serine/threonine-protein phosphatase [SAR324 cluster bacterium]
MKSVHSSKIVPLNQVFSVLDASAGGFKLKTTLSQSLQKIHLKQYEFIQLTLLDKFIRCSGQIRWCSQLGNELVLGIELSGATQSIFKNLSRQQLSLPHTANNRFDFIYIHPQRWVQEMMLNLATKINCDCQTFGCTESMLEQLEHINTGFILIDDRSINDLEEWSRLRLKYFRHIPTMMLTDEISATLSQLQDKHEFFDIACRPMDIGEMLLKCFYFILHSGKLTQIKSRMDQPVERTPELATSQSNDTEFVLGIMDRVMDQSDLFLELIAFQEKLIQHSRIEDNVGAFQKWIMEQFKFRGHLWHLYDGYPRLMPGSMLEPNQAGFIERQQRIQKFLEDPNEFSQQPNLLLVKRNQLILEVFQHVESHDVIAGLMLCVQLMEPIFAMKNKDIELQRQHEITQRELSLAHHMLLEVFEPQIPGIPGMVHSIHFQPFEQLGGDFFNLFHVGDQSYGILIGDISGHGISSAMLSIMFQSYFSNFTKGMFDPEMVLNYINAISQPHVPDDHFASLCYAIYDCEEKKLVYTNAGFHEIVLIRDGKCSLLSSTMDILVGVFENETVEGFHQKEFQAQNNDILLFFTDALFEVMDKEGEVLGMKRLMEFLDTCALKSVEELTQALLKYTKAFSHNARFHDDVTLMIFQVHEED